MTEYQIIFLPLLCHVKNKVQQKTVLTNEWHLLAAAKRTALIQGGEKIDLLQVDLISHIKKFIAASENEVAQRPSERHNQPGKKIKGLLENLVKNGFQRRLTRLNHYRLHINSAQSNKTLHHFMNDAN